jgi:hypothetical protein
LHKTRLHASAKLTAVQKLQIQKPQRKNPKRKTTALFVMLVFWVVTPCALAETNSSEKHTAAIFSPEDGGNIFLRNVRIYLQVHTVVVQARRPTSPSKPP